MVQEKSSVEGLKNKLYSRTGKGSGERARAPLSPGESGAKVAWNSGESVARGPLRNRFDFLEREDHMLFAKKFFIVSIGFFVIAAAAAAYLFFGGANFISSQNIDLQIVAPSLIEGGSEAQIQIIIQNRNASELRLADLILEYPPGTRDPKDPQKEYPRERQSLGTIEPGRQVKRTASAIFYGEEGSTQKVRATLEYSIEGSTAIFTKEAEALFSIGSSPVSISVTAPQSVTAGAPFAIELLVHSNAEKPIEHVVIEAQYPAGFTALSASPRQSAGQRLWRLGELRPGASQTISLRGVLEGQDGDSRIFRFLAGQESDETATRIRVPFLSLPTTIAVARPIIAGSITLEGESGKTVAAPAGKILQGSIAWRNNSAEPVQDIEVVLTLRGPVLDRASIGSPTGFYQSSETSIIWTKSRDPSLARAEPGAGGTLQFSFATLLPGAGGTLYQNPVVDLALSLRAARPDEGAPQEVRGAAETQVTLASAAALSASASAQGGAIPPRAESTTQYAVTWSIKNSSNTLANAAVSAVLPPYVGFVSGGEGVVFEQASRTVRWSAGDIKAGAGYNSPARDANFVVSLTPSESQVGQAPTVTGAAAFTGTDRFAQVQVSATAEPPTTGAAVLPK